MAGATRLPRRGWGLPRAAALFLGGALLALAGEACTQDRTPELIGTWQATHLLERDGEGPSDGETPSGEDSRAVPFDFGPGDTVDVRLDDVSLRFDPDGHYVYTSTLDYYEEGTYEFSGEFLTTTPAVDSVGRQRVRVSTLDARRLHVLMSDDGRSRELAFERVE